jgi:hypothetical protein
MIRPACKDALVFWQDYADETPGEPAILIKKYSDVLSIEQGRHAINISLGVVEQFIKAIRRVVREDK